MLIYDKPVLVLNCKLGALAIMRSLGSLGVPIYGVDSDPHSPGLLSRYCKERHVVDFDPEKPQDYLDFILYLGKKIGSRTILIPTSDELSAFVANNSKQLSKYFLFPEISSDLVDSLISKEGMYHLALKNNVPTPKTIFPKKLEDVLRCVDEIFFPVMLKGIDGRRLQGRTGVRMVAVFDKDDLVENYKLLEDPDQPNLMIQELIPGADDQVYIFNGYFNAKSECLAAFTGYKVRQFPIHVGCASLGECCWNEDVAKLTIDFMKTIGYRGILDIGYRLDPRDGLYKVLDINPRVGQAFRLFLDESGIDVVRTLYLDLSGQKVPLIIPREGRRWMIEDWDFISCFHYYQEGTLKFREWLKSFRRLEEGAWFCWKDPYPFLFMKVAFMAKAFSWLLKQAGLKST